MGPNDIVDLVEASDPRVAPDGSAIAYVVTAPDLDRNRYTSAIWITGLDADLPPIPFTTGATRESRPRWSPDGSYLAYVAHPGQRGSALYVADIEGNDGVQLVALDEEIEDLVWTPDGSRLLLLARQPYAPHYEPDDDRDRPPRVIDRLQYRLDDVGWTIDRPRHVLSIAADGSDDGVATPLTHGPFSDLALAVSPDGSTVVIASARTETWDTDLSTHLYAVPVDGGEPRRLTKGTTTRGQPSWSPDGRHVAFVWGDRHSMTRHGQVGVIDVTADDPASSERLLTTDLDLHCAPYLAQARDPVWESDSTLLFQVDEAGNVPLYRAFLDGRRPERVIGGDRQVLGFDRSGGVLAFAASTAVAPADIHAVVDGDERRLTRHAEAFASKHAAVAPERFVARSPDGTEVEAWILRPPWASEHQRVPMVLNIHGGPFSQYGNRLFDEFQIQVGAGFAVVYANPRGSSGYSEAFSRAIRGPRASDDPGSGWGGVDYADLMAVVDEAVTRFAYVDPERLGVMGGSYGGYMTSWIIGHSDRFKVAISERAVNNLLTFAHTSDIGAHFPAGYIGSTHLDDPDEYVRQSPVTYWRNIRTPVLILHSENDLRCPIEQAEDLFVRLKMSGREVSFVRFPGEGHELSRKGAPRHRVRRHELILEWLAAHLC